MSDRIYVECCQQMVPVADAIPFHYGDGKVVRLCHIGKGCTQGQQPRRAQ